MADTKHPALSRICLDLGFQVTHGTIEFGSRSKAVELLSNTAQPADASTLNATVHLMVCSFNGIHTKKELGCCTWRRRSQRRLPGEKRYLSLPLAMKKRSAFLLFFFCENALNKRQRATKHAALINIRNECLHYFGNSFYV